MPVIVVGADTEPGRVVLQALLEPGREVRAFVSDEKVAEQLRALGVKVALGDVSDDSHLEGAATNCFSAVLITQASSDGRERSFATSSVERIGGMGQSSRSSRGDSGHLGRKRGSASNEDTRDSDGRPQRSRLGQKGYGVR